MGGGQFSPGHGELTPQQHSRLQAAGGVPGVCRSHSAHLSPGLCAAPGFCASPPTGAEVPFPSPRGCALSHPRCRAGAELGS